MPLLFPGAMAACECLVDRRCGVATATHGGLTPAAPVRVRLCIAKVAIASAGERRHDQERGASAPRNYTNAIATASANAPVGSLPNDCGSACASTSPEPRRAHTRRSCACAFVHRKSRNSVGRRTRTTKSGGRKPPVVWKPRLRGRFRTRSHTTTGRAGPRAGGVSPPWFHERDCNGVRQRTGDSLPNNCGSACASRSPEPRRAHVCRSSCMCVCASQKSQLRRPANAGTTKSGGRKPPVVPVTRWQ